jgi:hypothetical protein
MTITQLSNLFNLIVQNDADYRFYHYGFPSDMNINIGNNYDPLSDTGRLFPYVLLLPPILNSRAMESNTAAIYDTYQVEFLITDTYAYEQGVLTYKIDTTIELEQTLQILAKKLIQYLLDYSAVSNPPFNVGDYRIEFDPYRFTADTRSVRVTLDLVVPAICDDQSLDISFLPVDLEDIATADEENQQTNAGIAPVNMTAPKIAGAGLVNAKIDVIDDGTWSGDLPITFTYQWKKNGIDIIGETNNQYTTVLDDLGKSITCVVTATNISGSASATSNSIKIL